MERSRGLREHEHMSVSWDIADGRAQEESVIKRRAALTRHMKCTMKVMAQEQEMHQALALTGHSLRFSCAATRVVSLK